MNARHALGGGALALLIGAFGPWASVFGAISIGPTANAEISFVVFGGAALVALSAITGRGTRRASIVVGLLALSEAIYALVKIQQAKSDAGEWGALLQPGWGLYLTIIAGFFLVISTWIAKHEPTPVTS